MPQTDKNAEGISAPDLIVSTINTRNDEYIIMNKRELKMADNTVSALDIGSEALIIIASTMAGYIINLTPGWTKSFVLPIILTIVLFVIGFSLKSKKTTFISEILGMYKNPNNIESQK